MNIMNDQPNVDYVTYFTQQLPKDLAADRAKPQSDREALDARIESFRAKAAALSV